MKFGIFLIIILIVSSISFIVLAIITIRNHKKLEENISKELQDLLTYGLLAKRIIRIKGKDKSELKKLAYKVKERTGLEKLTEVSNKDWSNYRIEVLGLCVQFLDEVLNIIHGPDTKFKGEIMLAWQLWMNVDKGRNI